MKLFKAELTGTGRPVLLRGEVERGMLDKVGGQAGGWAGGRRQQLVVLPLALELYASASAFFCCRWISSFTAAAA